MLCRQLRLFSAAIELRARAGAIFAVDEYQLKARVANSNILRADVCVQVERLVTRVGVAGKASAAVSAISAEGAGIGICDVPVSAIVTDPVVCVTLVSDNPDKPHVRLGPARQL
eukprot:COSAG02_NODE_13919_length_1330_cov_1.914703_2_plen_114_part_00